MNTIYQHQIADDYQLPQFKHSIDATILTSNFFGLEGAEIATDFLKIILPNVW